MHRLIFFCLLFGAAKGSPLPAQDLSTARSQMIREARRVYVHVGTGTITVRFPTAVEHIQGIGFAAGTAGRFGDYLISQPDGRTLAITRASLGRPASHEFNLVTEGGVVMMVVRPADGAVPSKIELIAEES